MGTLREAARDRAWQGGLGLAPCRLGSVEFRVMIYRNQPPRLPTLVASGARGAPPRVEPPPSYGASARGRPRSSLAGGDSVIGPAKFRSQIHARMVDAWEQISGKLNPCEIR
jgi:hypothetical protein